MEFQAIFPTADDVMALEPEALGIRMLPVLRNWPEGHMFAIGELLERVAGDRGNAFPLASYPAERRQKVREVIEDAWRWLEREGAIEPNRHGGSPSRLSSLGRKLALDANAATLAIKNGKIQVLAKPGVGVAVLAEKLENLNFDTVQRELNRALISVKDDPEDAVTAACSLLESVCRSLLSELSLSLPVKKDIDGLIRAVQEPLGLSPGKTDLPSDIEADVRQILSGVTSVAKGIGALRTHGGDAHGREKGYRRIDARIARLSINAAGCLAMFLIETWEQKYPRALPVGNEPE